MYHGFYYRVELIRQNILFDKNKAALEIGCGTGKSLISFSKNFKKIYGFDISEDAINFFKKKIKAKNVYLRDVDMCSDIEKGYYNSFDIIYSSDTLEHVENPKLFFENIKLMLRKNGRAVIIFPNESNSNHHGVTWFDNIDMLLGAIGEGLEIIKIREVQHTKYFSFIYNYLWLRVRALVKKMVRISNLAPDINPQTFEHTDSFLLNKKHPYLASIIAIYPAILVWIARLGKICKYSELQNESIVNKNLLIELLKK